MSLLLVLSLVPRGFSPGTPQKPTLPNFKSIWNVRRRLNKFIRTLKCFVGKQVRTKNPFSLELVEFGIF